MIFKGVKQGEGPPTKFQWKGLWAPHSIWTWNDLKCFFCKQKLFFNSHYDYELISHQLFCQCKLIISFVFSFLSSVTLWQPIKYRKIDLSNIPVPQQKSMKNVILKIYFLYPWYTQNACSGAARGKLFGGQSTCIFKIISPLPVYK